MRLVLVWSAVLLMVAASIAHLPTSAFAEQASAVLRLSEPVEATAEYETFGGATLDADARTLALQELLSEPERYLGQPIQLNTRVAQVCQKKGCFFIAQDGAAMARVSFKDYGFFVPTNISGKRVTLAGELVRRNRSAAEAKYYAADIGGPSTAVAAGPVYEIVATAVRIPR